MNENLAIYKFEEQTVRTIPYLDFYAFCLGDCLKATHSNTTITSAIKAIHENIGDNHVIKNVISDSMGRERLGYFITESALTFLVSRSRTELGRKFNRWLHIEVLPSIRATGTYSISSANSSVKLSVNSRNSSEITINEINEAIEIIFKNCHIKPELIAGIKLNAISKLKPQLASIIEESRKLLIQSSVDDRLLLTPTQLGQKMDLSAIKVNKLLIEKGLQIKNVNQKSKKEPSYLPTDFGQEFSTFTLSTGSNGDSTSYQQLKWFDSVLTLFS